MSTLEGTTMHPRCRHIGSLWDLLKRFQLFGTSQNSIFSEKNNQIFGFPWCSTRKDLSLDVSITNVGLILTKLRWFQLLVKSQNSISNFSEKKNHIFGFPCCSTREDLTTDVSITNVGLISTKAGRFLFSGYGQTDRHGFFIILTWKHVGTQKISTQN